MPDDPLDPNATGGDPIDDAIDATADPTPASTALAASDVLNSPEYKALLKQNRKLARDNGQLIGQVTTARTAAEEARLAAEATRQAVVDAEITAALGEEGTAFWAEFAELSATDPVAAAKRLAEFRIAGAAAQSAAAGTEPAGGDPAAGEGTTVPATTPPPPAGGVDGGSPLGAAGREPDDTPEKVAAGLQSRYDEIVGRVQDPLTRNRVTMKERASGFIAYLGAAYVRATGNQPRDARR